jgi:hypothetical protein
LRGRLVSASLLLVGAAHAHAGPDSEVTSSFDEGHGLGVHFTLDYDFSYRHSVIEREAIDPNATPGRDPTTLRKEFVYSQQRHTIVPTLELGLFHDVWIYGALPYVITDSRQLEFDQRSSPCTFTGADASCVNRSNSTTIGDGILPMNGFDAHDPTVGFTDPNNPLIFRGPDRSGLDQLHLGLGWAPMNQRRDDTKPTWKLGAEFRIAVGKVAKLDRTNPNSQNGIGQGVDEVKLWTTVARRRGWAEPYVELWWQAPIGHTKDSPFFDPGFGARRTDKQQEAGVHFGFEAIAVDNVEDHERFSIDLSGHALAHFEGRAYTEMWEVFAFAGDPAGGGPLVLDGDPTTAGIQAMAHPGVTNVENYLEMGGQIAARAEIGPRVHIAALGAFSGETQHIITFTDAGVDLPTCKNSAVPPSCEVDSNDVVNPGTAEVNPLHVPLVDLVGHRYRSVGAMNFTIGAQLQVLF